MTRSLTAAEFRAMAGPDERSLHKSIIAYLHAVLPKSAMAVHLRNNPRSAATGAIEKSMGAIKGIPDIAILRCLGRVAFIEVKTQKGRLKPEQRAFREWCIQWGIPHCVARSIDDVAAFLVTLDIEVPA